MAGPPQMQDPGESHRPKTLTWLPVGPHEELVTFLNKVSPWVDITEDQNDSIIPTWSAANWDPDIDYKYNDILYLRRIGVSTQRQRRMRPWIRENEEEDNPTEYALLFGVDAARTGPNDMAGHSGMTPTDPAFQVSNQSAEGDELDQSLQRHELGLYESLELVAQEALNPRLRPSWPPNLTEALHPWFERSRWTQAQLYREVQPWPGEWNIRYGEHLNGAEGWYNAGTNDDVWNAIQPALQLVSYIIRSGHPYWQAMTSLFHLRAVDPSRDGRTPEQLAGEGSRPYVSIWPNLDDPRVPAPFQGLQVLSDLQFDDDSSRELCLSLLDQHLRFSFQNHTSASSYVNDEGRDFWIPRVSINAERIWPLLVPSFPDSVKAANLFILAGSLLHELAHACAATLRIMVTRPDILAGSRLGRHLSPEIVQALMDLGEEMLGESVLITVGQYQKRWPHEFFPEDKVQGEEGYNFEMYLWGAPTDSLPSNQQDQWSNLRPLVITSTFPGANPQPCQQGQVPPNTLTINAYERYLLSPSVQSWQQITAIPVEWYARLFQTAWWQSDFTKFQHQGLKFSHHPGSSAVPPQLRRSTGTESLLSANRNEMLMALGEETYTYLTDTMQRNVAGKGFTAISNYLLSLGYEAAEARIVEARFLNEANAGAHKIRELTRIADLVMANYNAVTVALDDSLPGAFDEMPDFSTSMVANNGILRTALQSMMQFNMLIDEEAAYEQDLINTYTLQQPPVRARLRYHLDGFRQRIDRVGQLITGVSIPLDLTLAGQTEVEGPGWMTTIQRFLDAQIESAVVFSSFTGIAALVESEDSESEVEFPSFTGITNEMRNLMTMFNTLVANTRLSHQRFSAQSHLLATNIATVDHILAHDLGSQHLLPAGSPFTALSRGKQLGVRAALQTAGMRELQGLVDGPIKQLIRRTLDNLRGVVEGLDLTAETLAAGGTDQEVTRRHPKWAQWLHEGFAFLDNQCRARMDRAARRGRGEVGVEDDPRVEDVQEVIFGWAGDDVLDRTFLENKFTILVVAPCYLADIT